MKFFSLLFFLCLFGPLQEGEVVTWSAEKRIQWDDFKGDPDPNVDAAATTVSGLSYHFSGYIAEGKLIYEYDVKAVFFPEKSWVRQDLKDEELLLHERLHFDITAWYAAKLRKAFDTISPVADPGNAVEAVYAKVSRALDSTQALYDRETDFSRNLREQLLWESRIRVYLESAYE